jgi:hypothetical protein
MAETEIPKPDVDTQTKPVEAPVEPVTNPETEEDPEWKARVEKLIQSSNDKLRTEYSKKIKEIQKENEMLKKEKMSENERREYEAQQLKDALETKERDLTRREMELLAVKTLEEKKLPSTFLEFVIGEDADKTTGRIEQLEKVFGEELKNAVNEKMKTYGREPNKGRATTDPNSFEGMTPKEILEKSKVDLDWWRKNEGAITEKFKMGYAQK